ncbi:MAG: hypothetical protein OXI79_06395 [Gammaproteobacteria bacterium]|nr:hypothetical protein [Gammaproteobacteria bacterium]
MQEILEVVKGVRQRIHDHRSLLGQNEAATRAALIDPLLRVLGWETDNPGLVVPEYSIPSSSSRADYALFRDAGAPAHRKPDVIVEAKKLGEQLDSAAAQAVNYCTLDGFEHFAVTDGQRWRVYWTRAPGALNEKLVAQFDIVSDGAEHATLKALVLWRPAVAQGVIQAAAAPLAVDGPGSGPGAAPSVSATVSASDIPNAPSAPALPAGAGWTPLAGLKPPAYSKPAELRMPSGETVAVKSWKSLMIEVTRWLVSQGLLQPTVEPIKVGARYILARTPEHPSGQGFTAPGHADSWYVETSYAAGPLVSNTCMIVRHVHADPGEFMVRIRPTEK